MRQLVSIALLTAGLGPVAGCTGGPEPVAPRPFRVVVIGPRGGLETGPTVKVYGYVEGGEASLVTVGTAPAQLGLGGSFEASVPCGPDGVRIHRVTARPRDGGAPSEAEVAWTTDATKPEIQVTSPADVAVAVTRDALRIEGTVTDISPVLLQVDGTPVALDGARFEFTRMLAEGNNPVRLTATDAAGHAAEFTLSLRRDTEPPVCQLEAVPATVRTRTFQLRGRTGEPGCRVFVNGEEATVEGEAFRHELTLAPGENAFDVVVRDAAGHSASGSGTLVMESREPPTVESLRDRLRQETTTTGGGWYVDQYKDLLEYGRDAWAPMVALAQEVCIGERQDPRLATQALEALAQLHVTDAIPLFERLADGANPQLTDQAMWLLERLGKPERANARLTQMHRELEGDASRAPALWNDIGTAHAHMNHFEASRDAYLKALDAARALGRADAPEMAGVWYNLSCQHCKMEEIPAALDAFETSRRVGRQDLSWAAKDGDLRGLRGEERFLKHFWESGDGGAVGLRAFDIALTHPESGLLIVQRASDRLARDPTLMVFLATMYQLNGRSADAAKTLDEVTALVPSLNWGSVARQRQFQALRGHPRFEELLAKSGGAGEPGAEPGAGGAGPGEAPPPGQPSALLRSVVRQTRAPGRIVVPSGAQKGQYAQWTNAQGQAEWWGLTDTTPDGGWLVERRVQTADGWVLMVHIVDPQGAVRQAGAAEFDPATGRPRSQLVQLQIGAGIIQPPDPSAPLGDGAEKLTAAGREWECTVRSREVQGRTVREWLHAGVPVLGLVKREVDGQPLLQLQSVGDDAKPAVQLQAQPRQGGGGGDF